MPRKRDTIPRTASAEELQLEAAALERIKSIGKNLGYHCLSNKVKGFFSQYKHSLSNMERRNKCYRGLSGLLTYGLKRAPPGTYYIYKEDILGVVRDTYPSGDDVAWLLTNQGNRPTVEVGVEDLFEDKV